MHLGARCRKVYRTGRGAQNHAILRLFGLIRAIAVGPATLIANRCRFMVVLGGHELMACGLLMAAISRVRMLRLILLLRRRAAQVFFTSLLT